MTAFVGAGDASVSPPPSPSGGALSEDPKASVKFELWRER